MQTSERTPAHLQVAPLQHRQLGHGHRRRGHHVTGTRLRERVVEKNRTMETISTMDRGVITHSLDGTRLLGINQAALDILGYDSAEDLMAAGFAWWPPRSRRGRREDARINRYSKNVGDSVSTECVRHDNGDIVHVMGNVKLIESDGELLLQRYLLDYRTRKRKKCARAPPARLIRHFRGLPARMLLQPGHQSGQALRVSGDRLRKLDEAVRRRAQS
ncbi:MAG: hypothetical protein ACLSVD_11605 [Eggerthellaceae bacterium]